MSSFLNITNKFVAYADPSPTTNPTQKNFDWALVVKNLTVSDPKSYTGSIPSGGTITLFDSTVATTVANDTQFTTTLSSMETSRYRFTFAGGTNPTLRTDRGLVLTGENVTLTPNADSTVTLQLGAGTFGTTVAGDSVFIPNEATGDATSVFSAINGGWWVVLAVISATKLQMTRPPGQSFSAAGQTVLLANDAQLQAFSADGVQVGDTVAISAGFTTNTRKSFAIDRITSTWFEVMSTTPIAIENSIAPSSTGITFYSDAQRFVHVETNQTAIVQLNGDLGENVRVVPIQAGDKTQPGWLTLMGDTHKLVLINKSSSLLSYICHSAK